MTHGKLWFTTAHTSTGTIFLDLPFRYETQWVELYNAEDRIYHRDAQIEEYEADEFGNDGMYLWEVSQGWGEDDVVLDTKSGYDYGEWYNGDDNYRVTVMARDKAHALKAAYDKIAMLKAEKEGIV